MKFRIPTCFISAVLSAQTYVVFTILAIIKYPLPLSPYRNWLSDLGNQIVNLQGAFFYNAGVILCALFLAIWFTAGISIWKLEHHKIQLRLLLISQVAGTLAALTLMLSALYPINHLKEHAFWSEINFIMFGISFGFSVAAFRYHPHIPKVLLFLGGITTILPSFVLFLNHTYWLEWVAVGSIMIYILSIGIAAFFFAMHWTNNDYDKFLIKVSCDCIG